MRRLALLLSFSIGFLSLSQEIAWVRIVSFGQQGRPQAFSLVLGAFLLGIALGAIAGRRICVRSPNVLRSAGLVLLLAAAMDFVALYLAATPVAVTLGSPRRLLFLLGLIGLNAGLKGILFPIVHHLGSEASVQRVGRSVSRVYLGNVLGATLGPIVTGFWLLDLVSVETVFALIGLMTAILAALALKYSGLRSAPVWLVPFCLVAVGVFTLLHPPGVLLEIAEHSVDGLHVRTMLQNKHGVIHMLAKGGSHDDDITYGGNAYDGCINVDMRVNSNSLDRAYLMEVLHPRPHRALVVGMSTGAWTAVIRGMPGIEVVDVIEINPGYLEVMRSYPEVSPALSDPRIHIHIDDARRWLRAHPQARYDLIFQNTTWHWRANTTLLLSKEYFSELAGHLSPGGIVAANATQSPDVFFTALSVFPHVSRYKSFAYMSFMPLAKHADAEALLRQSVVWGHPAFEDSQFVVGGLGWSLAHDRIESAGEFLAHSHGFEPPRVISDLNLVTEFRHGAAPPFAWLEILLPSGQSK